MNSSQRRFSTSFFNSRWELLAAVLIVSTGLIPVFGVLGLHSLAGLTAIVGFVLVAPLVAIFGDRFIESDEPGEFEDPVDELRTRYARGELSDTEFERRLDRLLETEDLDVTGNEKSRELERLRQ